MALLDREDRRKLVHLAMTTFAILLRWLVPWQAAALAIGAILLNWVVLPLSGMDRGLGRHGEHYVSGVKLYPVGVLIVVVLFPLPIAAAGWAALGVGDFASTVFGRKFGRTHLPWNKEKTWAGMIAFVIAAVPAGAFLLWFTALDSWRGPLLSPGAMDAVHGLSVLRIWTAAIVAGCAGAVLETVPIPRVNDNLTVPITAALATWIIVTCA
jgi:dolichol kinase